MIFGHEEMHEKYQTAIPAQQPGNGGLFSFPWSASLQRTKRI